MVNGRLLPYGDPRIAGFVGKTPLTSTFKVASIKIEMPTFLEVIPPDLENEFLFGFFLILCLSYSISRRVATKPTTVVTT